MKTIKVEQLFHIQYPPTLVYGHYRKVSGNIPFVTSKGTNNGVAGFVDKIENAILFPAGSITVPLKGTVMQAHLQVNDFYCAHQIAVLTAKNPLTIEQLLFYVKALRLNAFRFNYGRQADRTLKEIQIPDVSEIPPWISKIDIKMFEGKNESKSLKKSQQIDISKFVSFQLETIFEIKKGKRLTKANMKSGEYPFIGSTETNNGVTANVGQAPIHDGNTISVSYNGSVAEAFYQPVPYWASDDVNVLYPKFEMTPEIALFICAIIKLEKYRFNYGRKWHLERMKTHSIKLPIDSEKRPDFRFMHNYIETLEFSSQL